MTRQPRATAKPKISTISGTANQSFEPFEPTNPIPWPLLALTLALAAWGVLELVNNHLSLDDTAQLPAKAVATSTTQEVNQPTQGRDLFLAHCASCHQHNGAGIAQAIPPLAQSPYVAAQPKVLISIILLGISGEITVAGQTYNGRMPTFGHNLNDEQVAAIASYVRQSWNNEASAITAVQVSEQRQQLASRATPWAGSQELVSTFNLPCAADSSPSQLKEVHHEVK